MEQRRCFWFSRACPAIISTAALCLATLVPLSAAPHEDLIVSERGPHHRKLKRVVEVKRPDGSTVRQTNDAYTVLASGLHYLKDGRWVESRPEVELLQDGKGAIARQGQIKVEWAPNINTPSAITTTTPDNKVFRTHILGLALTDDTTGQSVLIAPIKHSIGAVRGNQVIYRDAFDGGVNADVLFVYERGKFEQNIVLREQLPINTPADLGMVPETTRLECWTEVVEAPEPTKEVRLLASESNALARRLMVQPDFRDETLHFGATTIGPGKAFLTEDGPEIRRSLAASVAKQWVRTADQRRFLIERVNFGTVKPELDALPQSASRDRQGEWKQLVSAPKQGKINRNFPAAPKLKDPFEDEGMHIAAVMPREKGFVLDYSQLVTTTNFTFAGNTTYFTIDGINLSGVTTIEGNTVVKGSNIWGSIGILGPIDCKTDLYRPAIFTSMSDDTVGDSISGSTGNPSTNWSGLNLDIYASNSVLKNVRFRFLEVPVMVEANIKVANAQFVGCRYPLYTFGDYAVEVDNGLFQDCEMLVSGTGFTFQGRHLTVNRCSQFGAVEWAAGYVHLTNSLLVGVTNWGNITYATNSTVHFTNDPAGIFQTAGAGQYYLATNSPYRDVGTTNIPASVMTDISQATTFPPIILPTNRVTVSTTLSPQAQRDGNQPDLGYHYAPIDYAAGYLPVTNCTLTLTGGVVIAPFGHTGIWLQDNSTLISEGSPTLPNRIAHYKVAQEQATNWGPQGNHTTFSSYNFGAAPSARFRFTHFDQPPAIGSHFWTDNTAWSFASLTLRDCEFSGGYVTFGGPTNSSIYLTNNLFNRVGPFFEYYSQLTAQNNLFRGTGLMGVSFYGGGPWTFKDNVFDSCEILDFGGITHDYNVYINCPYYLSPGTNTNDLVLTNLAWQTGAFGHFYQPTNSALLNNGSVTNAGLVQMYHYGVTTNGVKEASTQLDRGYHYVAVNPATGRPWDTDGDGTDDWAEDANGDGDVISDSGESDWNSVTNGAFRVFITRPQNGAIIP